MEKHVYERLIKNQPSASGFRNLSAIKARDVVLVVIRMRDAGWKWTSVVLERVNFQLKCAFKLKVIAKERGLWESCVVLLFWRSQLISVI